MSENMRWVLTMITSFLLLGMMLFMVYRMRQKRIAYLRYSKYIFVRIVLLVLIILVDKPQGVIVEIDPIVAFLDLPVMLNQIHG